MRTKKVNRYYCDYCKKSGCSAPHMHKHEERCTMNPNRKCGVCGMVDGHTEPMAVLLATLPDLAEYPPEATDGWTAAQGMDGDPLPKAVTEALPALREAAHNCPACILAAIRQKGIPVPMVEGFDFTAEMKAVWDEINAMRAEYCQHG